MKDYSLRDEKSRLIQATAISLHEHITELFDNGYDQGYADAKSELGKNAIDLAHEESDRAYQQGLEDAWGAVQNITKGEDKGGYSDEMLAVLFRNLSIHMIVQRYTPQDVIRMIKEYEEQQEQFAVGDEVYSDAFDDKGIITHITADKVSCVCIICNGFTMMKVGTDGLHKTGRHFPQIAEVLKEMRSEE